MQDYLFSHILNSTERFNLFTFCRENGIDLRSHSSNINEKLIKVGTKKRSVNIIFNIQELQHIVDTYHTTNHNKKSGILARAIHTIENFIQQPTATPINDLNILEEVLQSNLALKALKHFIDKQKIKLINIDLMPPKLMIDKNLAIKIINEIDTSNIHFYRKIKEGLSLAKKDIMEFYNINQNLK